MRSLLRHVPTIESRAAIASLVAAVALTGLKFAAYFATNSSAIFSDAVESIVNVAASAFAIYSLYLAHQPADADHPYGHGKVEFISAAVEGGMVLAAALVAVVKTVDQFIHNVDLHIEKLSLGLVLLGIALAVNGLLGAILERIGRRQDSATLIADGRHLLSDAITSLAAALGILVVHFTGWKYADPLAAIAVAIYIAVMGVKLVRDAVAGLMDRQDVSDQILLRSILDAHVGGREPRICSYHKLRHRHNGRYHWVDFHIMVPADWDVRRGHQVASTIEYEIEQALGVGNATAHVEPCPDPTCAACNAEEGSGFGVREKGSGFGVHGSGN
ncbi:MAG TPA: cation diffusion facilitator family transporter [Humisphaera sp.]|jgi:cation diffusion facilitator family transporter|nr:cation diffusion facilitator family transporter [Humisphaera sp.]